MNEPCSTDEIVERIKNILSGRVVKGYVYDRHVADTLGVSSSNLASMKKRNKVPYKEVLLFCDRCGLDPLKLIMKKKSC